MKHFSTRRNRHIHLAFGRWKCFFLRLFRCCILLRFFVVVFLLIIIVFLWQEIFFLIFFSLSPISDFFHKFIAAWFFVYGVELNESLLNTNQKIHSTNCRNRQHKQRKNREKMFIEMKVSSKAFDLVCQSHKLTFISVKCAAAFPMYLSTLNVGS